MKYVPFIGAGSALVTPMTRDDKVNYAEFAKMVDDQIKDGIDAVVVCGTTGEASTMYDEEHLSVIEECVKVVAHRVPVIAGTGSNYTAHAIELSQKAEKLGVDGLLHVTPYYNKTSQRGLINHFTMIAKSVDLPILLYNVPSRTGMTIQPETYAELAKIPNIVGTKEASGNLEQIRRTVELCGDELNLYSGNDDQIFDLLEMGAKGVISVLSDVLPKETSQIVKTYLNGDKEQSRRMQEYYMPLIKALFSDVNPIPVKAAVNLMGYDAGECRAPLFPMEEAKIAALADEMRKVGLRVC